MRIRCCRRIRASCWLGNLSETHLRTFIGVLVAFAVALAASWIYRYGLMPELRFVLGTAIFAGFILLGDMFPIRITERHSVGMWDVGLIAATVVLGPTWASLAALPSAFLVGRRDWLRTIYEASHTVIITYLAGTIFSFVSEPLLAANSEPFAPVLYGTTMAGVTLLAANKVISGVLLKIKYNQTFYETWKQIAEPYLLSDIIAVLTAGLGVLALMVYGPVAALVAIVGSVGSQALVYRSREQVKENQELRARVGSLERALMTSNMVFGTMMVQDLGRRDGYMHRHAAATAVYAQDLALEMKLDEGHARRLRMAGLLHNIGLFSLPEELLTTTGRLNSIARSELAEHSVLGEKALAAVAEFKDMAGWVRWHHERPDGRGYPDKLRSTWIPLEAKILAVAQAYAAMVLDQPRRPGMSPLEAREKLSAGIDTEFDGIVVRAFLRILDTETEGYRMADDHRFLFPTPGAEERESAPRGPNSRVEEANGPETSSQL